MLVRFGSPTPQPYAGWSLRASRATGLAVACWRPDIPIRCTGRCCSRSGPRPAGGAGHPSLQVALVRPCARPRPAPAARLRSPHPVHREVLTHALAGSAAGAGHPQPSGRDVDPRHPSPPTPRAGPPAMVDRVGETYVPAASARQPQRRPRPAHRAGGGRPGGALRRHRRRARRADRRRRRLPGRAAARGDRPAEWVVADREQWRLRVAAACTRLAALHVAADNPRAAVHAARRGLEVDPFCDPLRAPISALAATGDSAAEARRAGSTRGCCGSWASRRRRPARRRAPGRAGVTPLLHGRPWCRARIDHRPFRPASATPRLPTDRASRSDRSRDGSST